MKATFCWNFKSQASKFSKPCPFVNFVGNSNLHQFFWNPCFWLIIDCKECAVSTEAVYGYHMRWWHTIPEPLKASCFSMSGKWVRNPLSCFMASISMRLCTGYYFWIKFSSYWHFTNQSGLYVATCGVANATSFYSVAFKFSRLVANLATKIGDFLLWENVH